MLVILAGSFALAGCAGSPSQPSDTGIAPDDGPTVQPSPTPETPTPLDVSTLDACTVLPQADAEALAGTTLTEPLKVATSDVSSCTYPGDPNGPTAQVEIYVGDGAKKQLDIDKDTLGHSFTQPSGVGDEAWLEDGEIWARSGTTWVSIRVIRLDDMSLYAAALQTAMVAALGNLPQ